ncbi:YARHG domain-containing protein [Candidatus Parabeggiatoa sp. HSG14]|uniref:YARHG domain-containing protein n=1 Tax=Candidatus Parabeggiatoa sp. HSG14 TaxID=3055593 RepID=UPI0025A913AC|nr:YARHG domain-containing protein [Thiotrichales bacterium HSG14]
MFSKYQNVVLAAFVGIFIQLWALTTLAITRDEVIANAKRYATHQWNVLRGNANPQFNRLKTGQVMTGLPYHWNGFDTIGEFDSKIKSGKIAGNVPRISGTKKTKGKFAKFAGIDCSGFVSRAWGLKWKRGTSNLPGISTKIDWKNLKPGDILNKRNSHVRLFHKRTSNNASLFYESTTSMAYKGVVHRIISRDEKYTPRRYKKIKEGSTSIPVTTPTIPSVSAATTTPVIKKMRPNRLKALSSGKRQWIRIYGKNFTSHSKLEFRMVGVTKFSGRVPIFKSSKELWYKINVGPKANSWTVKVTNGKKRSKSYPFKVVTGPLVPGKYPESSIRTLSLSDLRGKSAWDLKVMRNEIFARHGYVFKTPDIKGYFNKQGWYESKSSGVVSQLTEIERANIKFIKKHETSVTPKTSDYPVLIMAWLSEIAYLNISKKLDNQQVKKALTAFQRDSRLPQTGSLDNRVWEKLSKLKLTSKTKVKLQSLINTKWRNSTAIKNCDPDLIWVAALLTEMGYFYEKLDNINIRKVKAAVKDFQRDIGVSQTGNLDKKTWERLSAIKLNTKKKSQIKTLRCR